MGSVAELVELRQRAEARRLRLDTLIRLRWLAVTGQLVAVLAVHYGFGFPLPIEGALVVIALSMALNLVLKVRYPFSYRMDVSAAVGLLAYDVLQLAALLYLTGGLENPFAFLFLAPVMISATTLPPARTAQLGALAMVCASALAFWHQPLPWTPGDSVPLPPLYIAGVWLSILLGLTFIGAYAWRVSEESRQLSDALAATELVLAREQHLSQLDGLAAAAAHELGTPLGTIALVVRELDRAMPETDPHKEDIGLLREQVERCRAILGTITSLGAEPEGPYGIMTVSHLLEEVVAPHRAVGPEIMVDTAGDGPEPACSRNAGLMYGLGNLIENAVDFARDRVRVSATWDQRVVRIEIRDDGGGFPPEVIDRLGEPYVTARSGPGRSREAGEGLGLGLFIAKTLIERTGASLSLSNGGPSDRGAVVTVRWPRESFEIKRRDVAVDAIG
jgi:two-component system sensor histidine kinase RegB